MALRTQIQKYTIIHNQKWLFAGKYKNTKIHNNTQSKMALGRQQRASILIRPDPVLSILSPRSSQTTQSESHETTNSLKRHDWTHSNL